MVSDASFSALGEALCIEQDNDGLRAAPLRLCIQFRASCPKLNASSESNCKSNL